MNPLVFLMGFPVVNVLSYLVHRHIEQPLQAWKSPGLIRFSPASRKWPRSTSGLSITAHAGHRAVGPKTVLPANAGLARKGPSRSGSDAV
jgi:hypothetical protein